MKIETEIKGTATKALLIGDIGGPGKSTTARSLTSWGWSLIEMDESGKLSEALNKDVFPKYDGDYANKIPDRKNAKGKVIRKAFNYTSRYLKAVDLKDDQTIDLKAKSMKHRNVIVDTAGYKLKNRKQLVDSADVLVVLMHPSKTNIERTLVLLRSLTNYDKEGKLNFIFVWSYRDKSNKSEDEVIEFYEPMIDKLFKKNKKHFVSFYYSKSWRRLDNEDKLIREEAYPKGFNGPMIGGYKNMVSYFDNLDRLMRGFGG